MTKHETALAKELDHLMDVFMPSEHWFGVEIHEHALWVLQAYYRDADKEKRAKDKKKK